MEFCLCWRSSEVERLPCKQRVGGSNPLASSSRFARLGSILAGSGRYPSGQRGQTVNLLAHAFGGSNPPLPTNCGNSSAVERQPSKLGVAGSNPVSRSSRLREGTSSPLDGPRQSRPFAPRRASGPASPWGEAGDPKRRAQRAGGSAAVAVGRGGDPGIHAEGVGGPGWPPSEDSAHVAQSAEHVLGKDGVTGSSPVMGSIPAVRAADRPGAGAPAGEASETRRVPPAEASLRTDVRAAGRRGAGVPPAEASLRTDVRAAGRRGAGVPPAEASLRTIVAALN